MKTTKLTGAARLAFIGALFASRAVGVSAPARHDVSDELARIAHTVEGANTPDIDAEEMGAPEVVERLFDRVPEAGEAVLNKAERARVRRELEAYRLTVYRVSLSDASAEGIANA